MLRFALASALMAAAAVAAGGQAGSAQAVAPRMSEGQIFYTEACGGCHGLNGVSAAGYIPVLEGRVGYLLCLREGREYVARLPNVAFANMSDDRLAQVLNFVMFGLGGESVPDGPFSGPYTSAEVRELRARPLKASALLELRRGILAKASQSCPESGRPVPTATSY